MSENVTVTNNGAEPFTGRFDGKHFTFEVGVPLTVPVKVAAFLFNYGMPEQLRQRVLVRNGWQVNGNPADMRGPVHALERLRSFAFTAAADDVPPPKPKPKVLPSLKKVAERTSAEREKGKLAQPDPDTGIVGDPPRARTAVLPGRSAPPAPTAAAQ